MKKHAAPPFLAFLLIAFPCSAGPIQWHHEIGLDHPLLGRIINVASGDQVSEAALIEHAAVADWLLIGERHDNRDHHSLQARIIESLQGRAPEPRSVAYEMVSHELQSAIDDHLSHKPGDVAGLEAVTGWRDSGWPDWSIYEPVFRAAIEGGAGVIAADLTSDEIDAIYENGLNTLPHEMLVTTGLDEPLSELFHAELLDELEASHCGMVSTEHLQPMASVQRARDAMLAHRLVASAVGRGILIAGNGHVRNDRGVALYLQNLRPDDVIVAIGLIEVDDGIDQRLETLPYDYVWLTPRVDDIDPCLAYREAFD